jgi:predicted RecA/RadA family phage recombinase
MATNQVYEGEVLSLLESALTHPARTGNLVESGDPVFVGSLVGVALDSADADTDTVRVATEGVWELAVTATTATADSAIAVGDKLYFQGTETKATGTITSDATAPSDGDTVTIGTTVYTYKTALTTSPAAVPYEVLIGVSAAVALDNLKLAINATEGGAGSTYGTGTVAHPTVEATTNANTTQVVQALTAGQAGNDIATTETSSHLAWGATTMSGGSAASTLTKTSTDLGFGVALGTVAAGQADTIPVKLKRKQI